MAEDARLQRIESKLDEVGKAIVALARMEERMITLFRRMDALDQSQADQGRRLTLVERHTGTNGQMLRFAERAFWVGVAGVASLLVKWGA